MLLCDEPVNGLHPDGNRWTRTLLRGLAAEGRTVFISRTQIGELALTADHLIRPAGATRGCFSMARTAAASSRPP